MRSNLLLNQLHLGFKELLSLKNIPKDFLVPDFDALLEALLEAVHEGAINCLCLFPPDLDILKKIQMREPTFLKPEGLLVGLIESVKGKAYWLVVQSRSR